MQMSTLAGWLPISRLYAGDDSTFRLTKSPTARRSKNSPGLNALLAHRDGVLPKQDDNEADA